MPHKSSDEVPDRATMKLYRTNHTIIYGSRFNSNFTTIMKEIISLSNKLSNSLLGKIVIYR